MGVKLTILNDTAQAADVAIHLKGGARLDRRRALGPGESWSKVDAGLAASCPYDIRVVRASAKQVRCWQRPFEAPPPKTELSIELSHVVTDEYLRTQWAEIRDAEGREVKQRTDAGRGDCGGSDEEGTGEHHRKKASPLASSAGQASGDPHQDRKANC
mmetsp:Transcript_37815/g.73246  ORF Transcript_37815/g.73246 Transcript_37815/m.73246 type:complete len:158 (+) Transcript_37815:101-574(+)